MEQEKLVLLIAILLLINLFFTGWTFTRSMMRPLEKREGYGFASAAGLTIPPQSRITSQTAARF